MTAPDNATPTVSPPPAARAPRPTSRSTPLLIAGALALILVLIAVAWHTTSNHPAATSATTTTTQYAAANVTTVDLNGINGTLTVGASNTPQITATAEPANGHPAPTLTFHRDAATHVLTLTCASSTTPASTCPTSTYTVLVPAHMGVTLHEVYGQATLTNLSGPLSITASSADTTVQDLRTTDFTATIISGTLSATFATPPTHVSVSVTSAQASLLFPSNATYDVQKQTVSADIQVAIPQSPTSPHTVHVSATSGTINLATNN
jgi:hypothetical protein